MRIIQCTSCCLFSPMGWQHHKLPCDCREKVSHSHGQACWRHLGCVAYERTSGFTNQPMKKRCPAVYSEFLFDMKFEIVLMDFEKQAFHHFCFGYERRMWHVRGSKMSRERRDGNERRFSIWPKSQQLALIS